MDTMLSLRFVVLSLLLRLNANSENVVSASVHHSKFKRDLSGYAYMTLEPPILQPPKKTNGVISAFSQDDSVSSIDTPPITKSMGKKNGTKSKDNSSGQIRNSGLHFDPTNINIQLTEAPSINGRSLAFPNNRINSETQLNDLSVNQNINIRSSGDSAKPRVTTYLNSSFQKQKSPFDSINRFPIFSSFYGDPLLPIASQSVRNPVYKTKHQELKGTKSENNSRPPIYSTAFQTVPTKVVTYSYFPFQSEFVGLNKPRVLTAGTNVKLQAKPLYSFNFPTYDIPTIGNGNAFQVQPNAIRQEQFLPLQSASNIPQFPLFSGVASVPSSQKVKKVGQLEAYQSLVDQPQLHFGNLDAWRPVVNNQIRILKPFEKIRTDVEVVDRKKPAPPKPLPDDDSDVDGSNEDDDERNDEDEGYRFALKEYDANPTDEDDYVGKFAKGKDTEKSSGKMYGFQLYDEKFGKNLKKPEVNNKVKKPPTPLTDFSFNSDDEDSDEYLSKFYGDYSPKHDYEEKSAEETKMNEKQESEEDDDYRASTQSSYGSYEEEFEKNYRPLVNKKNPSKKFVSGKAKLHKIDESTAYPQETRGSGKVAEYPRNNKQTQSNWYNVQYSSQDPIEFNDQSGNKKQASISYKRNVELDSSNDANKNNVSAIINADSFRYKFPKAKSTLKPINHHVDAGIHTNSQSRVASGFAVNPSFHKSNIPGNENEPPQEARNSYSVSPENKWSLNKRSKDKIDNRDGSRLKAFSDVYVPSNLSFFVAKDLN